LLIVFQQCDFYFAGNWHAEAVEEYEEEMLCLYSNDILLLTRNCTIKRCHL